MKLLCTGDIHLGAGMDLGAHPGDRLRDQAEVLGRIAGIAVERGVDGVLVAGDVFDGPGVPPEQLDVFARFIATLHAAHIPLLGIVGNGKHDAAMREVNGLAIFNRFGPGIDFDSAPQVTSFAGCAVATLPWVHPGRFIAQRGGQIDDRDSVNEAVARLLVTAADRLREECEAGYPGCPRILLGHWSVSGTALPNGLPVDQLREPVLDADLLDELGFDHLVFGHIHHAQGFGERGFYVGSPMPLNFGEADDLHGVVILHTNEREAIDFHAAEFVPIQSRPLVTLDCEFDDDGLLARVLLHGELDGAIVRVRYTATRAQQEKISVADLRLAFLDAGAAVVRVQPTIVREERARARGLDEQASELDAFDQWAAAYDFPADVAQRMRAQLAGYLEAA